MKRMKKTLALLFCIGVFLLVFGTIPTEAATFKWEVSDVQLEHKKISFTIGQVEKAQNAAIVVMNSQNEEILSLDFSVSNQKEEIVVDLEGEQCLQADTENGAAKTEYYLYVKDEEGNVATDTYQVYLQHHKYSQVTVAAYPNWVAISNFNQDGMHASASVNFQEYEGEQDENGDIIIKYPRQEDETYVQVKWWDDYGCSGMREKRVQSDSYIFLPGLEVFRESTEIISDWLQSDRRLAVKIGDEVYYSSYGAGYYYTNAVTYPAISKGISSVTAWVECENGSRSNERTYDVSHCKLENCKYNIQAYPGRALGTVEANEYGQSVVSVSVTIGGHKYQADIRNGAFKLEYPKQKNHVSLKFIFTDAHGCSYSVREEVYNSLYNDSISNYVLKKNILKKYTIAELFYKDMRLCVRVGGKTYYSKYSGKRDETVRVSYPQQKVGAPLIIWVEHKNTSHTKEAKREIYDRKIKYSVKAKPKEVSGKYLSNKKAKIVVIASGKEYKCKMVKKWDYDYDNYYSFSASYPRQKVNSYIKIKITDEDGYSCTEKIKLKNIPPKLSVSDVNSGSVKITGKTVAGAKVTAQIKGKKYKGKANKSGKYTIKIKQARVGTKIKVTTVTPEGYTKSKTVKVKLAYGYVSVPDYIYKTSNSITLKVSEGQKEDKLIVNVGGAIYTKTIKKTKKNQNVTVNINPAAAGTGVEVKLCDKFGKVKDTCHDMVYFGDSIYVGMTAEEACLTTWGFPQRNDWGDIIQWVFKSGSTWLYVYIEDGRVAYIQRLNY